ncbi:MAG: TadE/TadG family type IV pilus assembly protein [Erythrobacter sp.]|nr:TadE/TadG family type IV pilus assembly protein [Erythrobacter sp.]MDZ4272002.1 TadE/TadG family type IV pilus assembly protein [Erythrobacter sp.]
MKRLLTMWRDRQAASAAEFVLVLPVALLLLFGIIDVGNYAWTLNEYEKATQMGTRHAVVSNMVSSGIQNESYVGKVCNGTALRAGDRICREALGTLECSSTGCVCAVAPCPGGTGSNAAAFTGLVERMQAIQPDITPGSVRVVYRGSGLGFAGDPTPPEIAPLVTVRIVDATYTPISLSPFGATVGLPDFSYSLTLEDGEGA